MKKHRRKTFEKKELKVNKNNDILSTIELFQYFEKKYNIITATLDKGIQYETDKTRITQTFTKTILHTNTNQMIKQLQKQGKITILIIDNFKTNSHNRKIIEKKIDELNKLSNVTAKKIKQDETYDTIDSIIQKEG